MRTIRPSVQDIGALVDLRLSLTAADVRAVRQAGGRVPPVPVKALIDLNAEISRVDSFALSPFKAAGLRMALYGRSASPSPRLPSGLICTDFAAPSSIHPGDPRTT
jgi:hypothetical protein